jgi:DNA replication protein DnaC
LVHEEVAPYSAEKQGHENSAQASLAEPESDEDQSYDDLDPWEWEEAERKFSILKEAELELELLEHAEKRIDLNEEQQKGVDLILDGRNVFYTGPAGTGKSHVLRAFVGQLEAQGKHVYITAPTNLAALKIGGVTLS